MEYSEIVMDVSVAMATYNGQQFIKPQLDSIIKQTRTPDEIVIFDDNSADGTYEILRSYEDRYRDMIKLTQNSANLGVRHNFQKCIERCQGDVIALSDQDDVWFPYKLERQISLFRSLDYQLLFHDSQIVSSTLTPIGSHWEKIGYRCGTSRSPDNAVRELTKTPFVKGSTILFDSDLRDYVLPIPDNWGHDFYISFLSAAMGGLYDIDEPLHMYRRHDNQESNHVTGSMLRKIWRGVANGATPGDISTKAQCWRTLYGRLEEIPEDKLAMNKRKLLQLVDARQTFEESRSQIYSNNDDFTMRMRHLLKIILNNGYRTYGGVPTPLYILKDGIACLNPSLVS